MTDALVGTRVGAYEILDRIGQGGMGAVYKARETLLHRVVALKIVHPKFTGHREILDRFFREALLHANLNHPNIVSIYTAGTAAGMPFIAMEFVNGGNLADFLRSQGRLSSRAALEFMLQICGAVDAAHTANIVHRDLKPNNILVDNSGTLKLMDFGIARRSDDSLERLTRQGDILGTPAYMAPEQFTGEAVDNRSDIYSLGVIFYSLLTQRLPFEGDTPQAIMHKAVTENFAPVESYSPNVPNSIRKIVTKAISREPKDRYSGIRSLKSALDKCALEQDLAGFLT